MSQEYPLHLRRFPSENDSLPTFKKKKQNRFPHKPNRAQNSPRESPSPFESKKTAFLFPIRCERPNSSKRRKHFSAFKFCHPNLWWYQPSNEPCRKRDSRMFPQHLRQTTPRTKAKNPRRQLRSKAAQIHDPNEEFS